MSELLQQLEQELCTTTPAELPELLAGIEALKARAWLRLQIAPTPASKITALDKLLDTKEAAEALGVSPSWLYHRKNSLPFVVSVPGLRSVKYSTNGIQKWIEQNRNGGK